MFGGLAMAAKSADLRSMPPSAAARKNPGPMKPTAKKSGARAGAQAKKTPPSAKKATKLAKASGKDAKKSAKTSAKGGGAAPAAGVEARLVRATAALRKEYEKARARIQKLRSLGSEAFDELYEEVARVLESDPPIYVGGGHRTREAFIAAELPGETVRSVQRNVLVALCFSPADEARHGINFLEEVAQYAKELSGAAEPPRAIDLDKLRVPVRRKDGDEVKKPARDATIDEVRKARRGLRRGKTPRRNAPPLEKTLRAALGKHKALAHIAVRAAKGTVSLGSIPASGLRALGEVLAKVELPAEE
jgi:hypothetical protein